MKPTLADAANTLVPAYLPLRQRGVSVRRDPLAGAGSEIHWAAEGPDHRFVAVDPLTLLGLYALHERRGSTWQTSHDEIEQFITELGNA